MARINGPIQVWFRNDTVPTDEQGGYAGGDSTAAAVGMSLDQSSKALGTVDNLAVTARTLDYGQAATATISGDSPWKTIDIGIPKGMSDDVGAQLTADAAASADAAALARDDADAAVLLAQQAQAASLEVPDANMAAAIENPATLTRAAIATVLADVGNNIFAPATTTPTLEEQSQSTILASGEVTASVTLPIHAALFASKVEQVALISATPVPVSSTDYWTVSLNRWRFGVAQSIASQSTVGAGREIVPFKPWGMDTVEFTEFALLAEGDTVTVTLTPVGSPPPLTSPTVAFRAPATNETAPVEPVVLLADDFNRADSTTGVGSPDVGSAWVSENPAVVWGISSGAAYVVTPREPGETRRLVAECYESDVTITSRIRSGTGLGRSAGLTFRYVDANNHLLIVPDGKVYQTVGGTTTLLTGSFGGMANGDTVRIACSGSTVEVSVDAGSTGTFAAPVAYTITDLQTATMHGLRAGGDGETDRCEYDSIVVTAP